MTEAAVWTNLPKLAQLSELSRQSGALWQKLADTALTDEISEFKELKELKLAASEKRRTGTLAEREAIQATIREKIKQVGESPERLTAIQNDLFNRMADIVDAIAKVEAELMIELRVSVGV